MAAVIAYLLLPDHRDVLAFAVAAVGAAAAILSVIYLGTSIRESVRSERWNRTFQYHERWSDDRLRSARGLLSKVPSGEDPAAVVATIRADSDAERSAITLMNYFEEMALGVRVGAIDEDLLRLYFRTPLRRVWVVFEPWIYQVRAERGPAIYMEVEAMHSRWESTATRGL